MAKKKAQPLEIVLKAEMTTMETILAEVDSCVFLPVTAAISAVLPEEELGDFWGEVAENAPFSWGDNNRSLVTADAFARHCGERLEPTERNLQLLRFLLSLGDLYLDLEN